MEDLGQEAAAGAVKGFTATKVTTEKEKGRMVYELKGKAEGQEYEIKVTADGKVIGLKDEEDE